MKKITVTYHTAIRKYGRSGWAITMGTDYSTHATKAMAVKIARAKARTTATYGKPISLVIRKKNGQIQEECTYPRSRDPRRSRG